MGYVVKMSLTILPDFFFKR